MKIVLKLITTPITLVLDLTTWIFMGLISCSTVLFRLVSGIVSLLAIAVLVTYSDSFDHRIPGQPHGDSDAGCMAAWNTSMCERHT